MLGTTSGRPAPGTSLIWADSRVNAPAGSCRNTSPTPATIKSTSGASENTV